MSVAVTFQECSPSAKGSVEVAPALSVTEMVSLLGLPSFSLKYWAVKRSEFCVGPEALIVNVRESTVKVYEAMPSSVSADFSNEKVGRFAVSTAELAGDSSENESGVDDDVVTVAVEVAVEVPSSFRAAILRV